MPTRGLISWQQWQKEEAVEMRHFICLPAPCSGLAGGEGVGMLWRGGSWAQLCPAAQPWMPARSTQAPAALVVRGSVFSPRDWEALDQLPVSLLSPAQRSLVLDL